MRLVSAAKHAALTTSYQRVARQRDDLAQLAKDRLSTINRQAEEITRLRDAKPSTPVREPEPVHGDAELRRQLALERQAHASLDEQCRLLQSSNEAQIRELYDLRVNGDAS